jgi:carboxypeptidase Taq
MPPALEQLRERLGQVHDLHVVAMGLSWDQQVIMPPRGAPGRAEALGTLETLAHERFASEETGALIAAAREELNGADPDGFAASLVRVAARDWEKETKVPVALKAELARAGALGYEAWTKARGASDWGIFRPHLARMVELRREYAACFPEADSAYDALLDDFEPGMRNAEVAEVFRRVRETLVPFLAEIAERADRVDNAFLTGDYPVAAQEALVRRVIAEVGFDPEGWRLDVAVHPFAASLGTQDIRITTRFDDDSFLMAYFSALHETGHGLYEAGSDPSLERTLLSGGVSLGLHESQSRLWENVIGRSRAFCGWALPGLREAFPGPMAGVSEDEFYAAINRVEPGLIRIQADEATYPLHIIIRWELEQAIFDGGLDLADLPEAWNAKYRDYLGLEVPDDAHGVLQDVHWSEGMLGYFPTYLLGNVMAGQIWQRLAGEIPGVEALVAAGDFAPIRAWLTDRLYRHGRIRTPAETLSHAAGGPLDAGPYLDYLTGKFGALYGIS